MNVCMYVCMYVCMRVYVCMYACMYVCVYVCMRVCVYMCTHKSGELYDKMIHYAVGKDFVGKKYYPNYDYSCKYNNILNIVYYVMYNTCISFTFVV